MMKFKNIDSIKTNIKCGNYSILKTQSFELDNKTYELARHDDTDYTFIADGNMNDMLYIRILWNSPKMNFVKNLIIKTINI